MISVVVLTKNEERNIIDCLENLFWCDEIIVVDDYSQDRTVEIIQNLNNKKIKVFKRRLNGNFSTQRNFGLSKAKGDRILFIDADERVPNALALEISNFKFQISNFKGFYIKRVDNIWGKELKHGETGDIWLLRLAKKNFGKWESKVHEEWKIKGKIGKLRNPIIHYPHQTVGEFLKEVNHYTDIRSKELFKKGIKSNTVSVIAYPLGKFLYNYFVKLGILDGSQGLIFAVIMSFHSFLTRGKLWFLSKRD